MIDFDESDSIIVFKMVISNDKWSNKVLVILILVPNIIPILNSTNIMSKTYNDDYQ